MRNSDHLDLIGKILRKAESTTSEAERDMLFTRAQKLATRHSIDLAVARAHTAKAEAREEIEEQTVVLGERGRNGLVKYVNLFSAIARANDCKILISSDSTVVYVHGFPSDIDVVKALYSSLVIQMVQAGDAYLRKGEYKQEKVWIEGKYKRVRDDYAWSGWTEEYVPGHYGSVHGKTARANFYDGFINAISKRLQDAKAEEEAAAIAEDDVARSASIVEQADGPALSVSTANLPISTALVLQEKKQAVEQHMADYIKRNKVGTWKAGRRGNSATSSHARSAGRAAGQRASLRGGSAAIGA